VNETRRQDIIPVAFSCHVRSGVPTSSWRSSVFDFRRDDITGEQSKQRQQDERFDRLETEKSVERKIRQGDQRRVEQRLGRVGLYRRTARPHEQEDGQDGEGKPTTLA